jgi:acyl-CoA reductase-like NAD-dependent aldehyde dehydrogenase
LKSLIFFIVNGVWKDAENTVDIIDPCTGEFFMTVPDTKTESEIQEIVKSAS